MHPMPYEEMIYQLSIYRCRYVLACSYPSIRADATSHEHIWAQSITISTWGWILMEVWNHGLGSTTWEIPRIMPVLFLVKRSRMVSYGCVTVLYLNQHLHYTLRYRGR